MKDYPSRARIKNAQAAMSEDVSRMEKWAKKAFAHYTNGNHPFTVFRYLISDSKTFDDKSSSRKISFLGVDIFLHLKKTFFKTEVPEGVREKVAYDFIMSQAFSGGVFFSRELLNQNPQSLKRLLQHFDDTNSFPLDELFHEAHRHPQELKQYATSLTNDAESMFRIAFRARMIDAVLNQTSYFASTQPLLKFFSKFANRHDIKLLVLLLSEKHWDEKTKWAEELKKVGFQEGTDSHRFYCHYFASWMDGLKKV